MIYIYIFVPLIFIGLFIWNTVRGNKHLKQLKEYSQNPDVSRIILWIELVAINGEKPDYTYSYWKNVKSKASNTNHDVVVLLLKKGEYNFVVSSKSNSEYKKVPLKINIESGITYQLGCNDEGVYFVEDLEPNRYNL